MKYFGLRVYDMEESIVASGFPMLKKQYTPWIFEEEVTLLGAWMVVLGHEKIYELAKKHTKDTEYESESKRRAVIHFRRACNLGSAKAGSGHDCMLKGIVVNVNIKADQSFWLQWERYHHQDTVSSMSTMHCISKFEIDYDLFSKYTDQRVLDVLKEKIEKFNNAPTQSNFHEVIHNCPEGIELTRRITTNYLQLKTMYLQRENHKMFAWSKDFIEMCEELPCFKMFAFKE